MDPTGIQLALEQKGEVGICLLQDAVYYGCKGRDGEGSVTNGIKNGIPVHVAKKDIELRGLTKLLHPEVKILDYNEIIDLIMNHEKIVNM